jgi:predicted unusual protein kinase regulating ubiquinone biosynthesis (AarF/ABC1/UbiB family)
VASRPDAPLETRPLLRNLALSRLGVGVGLRLGGHLLANALRGADARERADRAFYRAQADALAAELGRLKGSAMKAGQLLALLGQNVLPEEALATLSQLNELAVPVPWDTLAPVVRRALGRERMAGLEFDETPIGAASLGQVHRARRRSDGAQLCFKVQYPGVAEAIDSDVQSLGRLLLWARIAPRDFDLHPTLAELTRLLHQEADYAREREFTEEFARRLAGDARFVVPRVYREYCTPHVLAMSYEEGLGVNDPAVQALPLERRNAMAAALIELFLSEFFDWGLVQTDPNFGNYRFRIRGQTTNSMNGPATAGREGISGLTPNSDRIVLLDFGACRRFPAEFVDGYRDIVVGALTRDTPRVVRGSTALDMLRPGLAQEIYDGYARACQVIVEPFNDHARDGTPAHVLTAGGAYRWRGSDMLSRASAATARNAMTVHFRLPPPELVFLNRRLMGTFRMLGVLGAELNARPLLERALGSELTHINGRRGDIA